MTLTFPITAGFGSNDFYGSLDQQHRPDRRRRRSASSPRGVDARLHRSPFIPECYGTWTVNAGYTYYYLGDGTADFNTVERGGAVRDYNEHEHVFSGGLMVAF